MATTISSNWEGLSPHLVASIYQVEKKGGRWQALPDDQRVIVKVPLTEASIQIETSWQSRFEDSGTDSQFPAASSLLQTGAGEEFLASLTGDSELGGSARDFAARFVGRTSVTKLNSTQVFSGMPPVKIDATAIARAWADPQAEVMAVLDQLAEWQLPPEITDDSSVVSRALNSGDGLVETLMPSLSPILVALKYKGRVYAPLVIESMTIPIDAPTDAKGRLVDVKIPLSMSTLSAIDRRDWQRIKKSSL